MNKIIKTVAAIATAFFIGVVSSNSHSTAHAYTIDRSYQINGVNRRANSNYIIAHETGTEASAINNAQYEHRTWSTSQAYVTYIVGDGGHVYQIGRPGYVSWGAGSYANANAPVQIELARTTNATQFKTDYATYVTLLRDSAKQFGLPLRVDQGRGIISHKYVSDNWWGDHQDPYGYLARFGITKAQFARDIANGVAGAGSVTTSAPTTTQSTTPTKQQATSGARHTESGTFTANQALTVWTGAGYGNTGVKYYAGESFTYDSYVINGRYVYASYLTNSGNRRYVAVREYSTQRTLGTFGATKQQATSGIAVDGYWGANTTRALQRVYGTYQDGSISHPSVVIKAIQRNLGVRADGYLGPQTIRAMQSRLGTPQDGRISQPSMMVKAMQVKLNQGVKPF